MPVSANHHQTLDTETKQTLESSLAMQMIKLFAIVARADEVVTDKETVYVSSFLDKFYPVNISRYLYNRFEEYISKDLDYHEVARSINSKLSYQEKVFCLIKTYELIISDEAEEIEINLAHNIADLLHIKSADLDFIENSFGLRKVPDEKLKESTIIPLLITGDISTADVYLPFPGLELVIYKIINIYFLIQKDNVHKVVVNDHPLLRNLSRRVPHNTDFLINDYIIKYHDIKIYFDNKVYSFQTDLCINRHGREFSVVSAETSDSILKLSVNGSLMYLIPLGKDVDITVNNTEVSGPINVNLNDNVYVGGFHLNLREIFFNLNLQHEIPLDKSRELYEITNDTRGDVYISDDLSEKWSAKIYKENGRYIFTTGDCPYSIFLNRKSFSGSKKISRSNTIYIKNNFLVFDFENHTVKKTVFSFRKMIADTINYVFDNGALALDNISFDINLGDLVCIMGPSGGGKSTLLNILSGLCRPSRGNIFLDQHDFYQHFEVIKDYLGYVPQDDLLLANLTVYENLYYYAKLRFPHKSKVELAARIELVLNDIGLSDKKNSKVGHITHKTLSGGERKRLNIGLELLTDAEVYILDEPTSGLSSKDSEKIINLLANLANRGKIVLAVIHQPGSKLYKMFNKVILLDKGGRLAYQGSTFSALRYFKDHMETHASGEIDEVECPFCKSVRPGLLLDSLEESLRDIDGTTLSERKYSPEYWKNKYLQYTKEIGDIRLKHSMSVSLPPSRVITLSERSKQFITLLSRNFINKMRDRSNLLITFLEAPLLGIAVGFVLRYAPKEEYTLYNNHVFETFLFISVIIIIFLGLTNSLDEIIRDTPLFLRERMLNLQNRSYLASKMIVLIGFALVQNIIFLSIGFLLLEIKELYLYYMLYLGILSFAAISMGLFVSSIPNISTKAAQNIVPLILVPQIILGGALIKYKEMNKYLTYYEKSPIPEICQVMPSRWAFEGLMVLQESFNSYDTENERLIEKKKAFKLNRRDFIEKNSRELYETRLEQIEAEENSFREKFKFKYGNDSIHFAVNAADYDYTMKLSDSDSTGISHAGIIHAFRASYPMLVRRKILPVINKEVSTAYYNALVILFIAVVFNIFTLFMLRYRNKSIHLRVIKAFCRLFRPHQMKSQVAYSNSKG